MKMSIRHVNRMNILNARICKKNKIHTKPEKGGRKPAPSRNLFGSAKKCRGSARFCLASLHFCYFQQQGNLFKTHCLYICIYMTQLACTFLFCHTCPCFATLRHSFLGITPHPLANCLAPNPNGRCSPLSFRSLVFQYVCLYVPSFFKTMPFLHFMPFF